MMSADVEEPIPQSVPRAVAIVPVRSGSVGVKDKNVRTLQGKPLMAWAILALKKAKTIRRVIVDTDDETYAIIARTWGAETPWLRPAHLAEDVPTELVLINSVRELGRRNDFPEIIVCVQCTTPLIHPDEIDECVMQCSSPGADSAMTVCKISERPEWMFQIRSGLLKLWQGRVDGGETLKGSWGVRQTFPDYYRPNGACYAMRRELLLEKQRIIGDRCRPVVMPRLRSVDVDEEADFTILEAILDDSFLRGR